MAQNAVLHPQADLPEEPERPVAVPPARRPEPIDPVLSLVESFQRQDGMLDRYAETPHKRPFDAQYWACWVVAVVYPLLVAYLCLTR
jgi:hypothetical protein